MTVSSLLKRLAVMGAVGEVRPVISVKVRPTTPEQGDQITIDALMRNLQGNPISVSAIYMRILDRTNREVYPSSIMARNQPGMSVIISTRAFEPGTYMVQVSNHGSYDPVGLALFEVIETPDEPVPLIIVPPPQLLEPIVRALVPQNLQGEPSIQGVLVGRDQALIPSPSEIDEDVAIAITRDPPELARVRFKTQEDSRVCPICDPYNDRVYEEGDIRPDIPVHPRCRCYYEVLADGNA